ncbi:MAG: hypothetical protein ISR59_05675 [Anaerolineales bacterium]|nr:hypothetical protein [Anaerolineales bacterium]
MIKHIWSVVCQGSIEDKSTNLLSIINILEELTIEGDPSSDKILPLPIQVVTLWTRTNSDIPAQAESRYTFVSPSKTILKEQPLKINLSKYQRLRARVNFSMLNFTEGSGIYTFCVEYRGNQTEEWTEKASIPIDVNFHTVDKKNTVTKAKKVKIVKA